ncbi:unnamed protein product [Coffea canephora]|uniref:Phytosulfokine n=1 Tax=Coffea canephora TaxID=49390 RepID=A0A068V477_COFCA|nr:putative phytosulfokines 6 [Coffea arabica]CDP15367.1 unnamed protein product [Coffea canephora]
MRRGYYTYITSLLFFLLISRSISARLLPTNQASSSFSTTKADEDMASLMGLEECNGKDEACVQRRMIAEAHLDYIYTQHHKPKGSP